MRSRVQAPIARRGRESCVMWGVTKAFDLPEGALGQRSIAVSDVHLEIQASTVKGLDRVAAPRSGRATARDGDADQRSPLQHGLPLCQPRHGVIVWVACGGLIELLGAQGHTDGAGAHQLFHDLQTRSRMQEVCRKGMAERVRRVRLGDLGRAEIRGHPVVDGRTLSGVPGVRGLENTYVASGEWVRRHWRRACSTSGA